MRKLLKRWYVCLGVVVLLGLAGSAALIYSNPSRITRANFDRIQSGMTRDEVQAILGKAERCTKWRGRFQAGLPREGIRDGSGEIWEWDRGAVALVMVFDKDTLWVKKIRLRTVSDTLIWHAKKGAAKIGI